MGFFQKKKEPLLHQAIIADDLPTLKTLIPQKKLLNQRNSLNFTPLELAQLLGKTQCVSLLSETPSKVIPIILKGQSTATYCDEQDFEKLLGVTYLPYLKFASYDLLKRVIQQCPLILKYTFLGDDNRRLSKQYQRNLSSGEVADVTIQWINEQMGYGVFTNSDLKSGDFIGEYTGNVRQLHRLNPDHNPYCFHYPTRFFSWNYFMIDALKEGNALRYINHSDTPNLKPACLIDRGLLHLVLLANQPIPKGCQLTFNYGNDYWQSRQKI